MSTESLFAITVSSESLSVQNGRGQVTVTVTNTCGRALKGRAEVLPAKPEAGAWLSVARNPERVFTPGAVEQFVVQLNVPAGSPEGDHTFRLRVADVADPNERVTVGPAVGFKIAAAAPAPAPFRWWIPVAIGAVVLLLVGGGIVFWLLNREPSAVPEATVPNVTGKSVDEARAILEKEGFVVGEVARKVESKPANIVLDQKPAANATTAKGDTVTLVATDESMVLVPALNGQSEPQARSLLAGLLEVEKVERSCRQGGDAVNSVYESNPKPRDAVSRKTKVLLRVKDDCVPVPAIVGVDKGTAFSRLNAVGLLGNPTAGSVDANRVNVVEDQTPRPNDLLPKGATVTVTFFRTPNRFDRTTFIQELELQKRTVDLGRTVPR